MNSTNQFANESARFSPFLLVDSADAENFPHPMRRKTEMGAVYPRGGGFKLAERVFRTSMSTFTKNG